MKAEITLMFEFRMPTEEEIAKWQDGEWKAYARLPVVAEEEDARFFFGVGSDLALWLRMMVAVLPDGARLRGDEIVEFVLSRFRSDDEAHVRRLVERRFRHMFFGDNLGVGFALGKVVVWKQVVGKQVVGKQVVGKAGMRMWCGYGGGCWYHEAEVGEE